MIDHLSLGVRDLARSAAFYDAVLGTLGWKRQYSDAVSAGYGPDRAILWLLAGTEPPPPSAESGLHVCFRAADGASVGAFHTAALAHGGTDNGPPGIREAYGPNYFAAFAVDPDGYRLEALCNRTPE